MPHSLMPCLDESSLMTFGMRSRVLGGAAWLEKNSPSFLPFSSVSGGYQEMSAGLPSKKSGEDRQYDNVADTWRHHRSLPGMNTCLGLSLSPLARISAPWKVCGKKPKMSYTTSKPDFALLEPVWYVFMPSTSVKLPFSL